MRNRKKRTPICHPERVHLAKGFCKPCYKKQLVPKPSSCHPEFPNFGKNLCRRCYMKEYYSKNSTHISKQRKSLRLNNHERAKAYARERGTGWNYESFNIAINLQAGLCAICTDIMKPGRGTHSDHNHLTGELRGLLCPKCNHAIGLLRESTSILKGAIDYLQLFNGVK